MRAIPEANAKSFFEADGKRWFRTGDQGTFDAEGYLTLTGRLKEIINRGGEKVSRWRSTVSCRPIRPSRRS
jgi:acyl-CoA synthetase (AMP-forming)/AMP-acid ligase II